MSIIEKIIQGNPDPQYKVGDVVTIYAKMGCAPEHEPPYWIVVGIHPLLGHYTLKFPHGDKPRDGVSIASFQHDEEIIGLYHNQDVPEKHKSFIYPKW